MTIGKDQVISILVRAFSPYVGPTMAEASVRGICERLAGKGASMDRPRVEAVLEALEPGLRVYVGKDKTRTVMHEVRIAIDAVEESP
jgi:hypothetical protein